MYKLLITGGNGQLGRAINNLYAGRDDIECINTDVGELDITNHEEVLSFVDKCRPYAIINCAAHTAVDLCEDQEELAYKINAIGPRNLSIAAEKYDCKIMQISTDYVFAGDASKPYKEFDTPNPQGVYGASKLAGENLCASYAELGKMETVVARSCHTFGPGMTETDSRAHAQFLRNAIAGKNVVLKSRGTQERSYLYVAERQFDETVIMECVGKFL